MFKSITLTDQDIKRFWSHINKNGPLWTNPETGETSHCWEWTKTRNQANYGRMNIGGTLHSTHRVGYLIAHGTIDDSLYVLHKCDNPPCSNGLHLFQGTPTDNMVDCARKGRNIAQTHPERIASGDNNGMRTHPERRWTPQAKVEHSNKTRGGNNPSAKITFAIAALVRTLRGQKVPQRAVAKIAGISKSQVARIEHGESWKDV